MKDIHHFQSINSMNLYIYKERQITSTGFASYPCILAISIAELYEYILLCDHSTGIITRKQKHSEISVYRWPDSVMIGVQHHVQKFLLIRVTMCILSMRCSGSSIAFSFRIETVSQTI